MGILIGDFTDTINFNMVLPYFQGQKIDISYWEEALNWLFVIAKLMLNFPENLLSINFDTVVAYVSFKNKVMKIRVYVEVIKLLHFKSGFSRFCVSALWFLAWQKLSMNLEPCNSTQGVYFHCIINIKL